MYHDAEVEVERKRPSLVRRLLAVVVLVAAVALALKIVIGFVMAIFWFAVAIAAVIAVLWALRTLRR
jgi:hypothetical protein